ncbi:hypothetical protein PR048_013077 [Dryococelus australis]|uniref:Uncharacterized protein n=1 Tax=Dryococelus australis TaxID=614101 RepID=A0ABQ9HRG8_9NEOP|nr:hypothetical protein PR048_013077 [Dryococelus australis]
MCRITSTIRTQPPAKDATTINVNASAVSGMIVIGGDIHKTAWDLMEEAAGEEARLAKEAEVDKDGNPLITVFADGGMAKRSYKN